MGPKPTVALPGQQYGRYTIIRELDRKGRHRQVLVRDENGVESAKGVNHLVYQTRPYRKGTAENRPRTDVSGVLYVYRAQAKSRGHKFTLSEAVFASLIGSRCHYCGREPSNNRSGFIYSGIDRVDNEKGYEMGNVVACCKDCNIAKGKRSTADFLAWIKRVADFNAL